MNPALIRMGLLTLAVLSVFLGGYFVKGKIEEAEQADVLRQQIRAQVERQDKLAAKAEAVEAELAVLRQKQSTINRKWSELRAQEPSPCLLGDSRIGLLRDATGPVGETPR